MDRMKASRQPTYAVRADEHTYHVLYCTDVDFHPILSLPLCTGIDGCQTMPERQDHCAGAKVGDVWGSYRTCLLVLFDCVLYAVRRLGPVTSEPGSLAVLAAAGLAVQATHPL